MYNLTMNEKKTNKNKTSEWSSLIYTGEWFDIRFAEFALEEKGVLKDIRETLTTPKYTVSETNQSYRTINNWDENKILFENVERGNGWRKFSITEIVWIEIIKELRTFGLSLSSIKEIRDKNFILKDEEFNPILLSFYIARAINGDDVLLVADAEGNGSFCITADYINSQIIKPLPTSYVIVNINKIYFRISKNQRYLKNNTHFMPMNSKELEMFGKIMEGNVSEIKIKPKDGKIGRISYKSSVIEPKEAMEELRKELSDKKMKSITINQDDSGKIVSIIKEEKT